MEQKCLNCHYLCKQGQLLRKTVATPIFPLNTKERGQLIFASDMDIHTDSLVCYAGHWRIRPGPKFTTQEQLTVLRERDSCTRFISYQSGKKLLVDADRDKRQRISISYIHFLFLSIGAGCIIILFIHFLN